MLQTSEITATSAALPAVESHQPTSADPAKSRHKTAAYAPVGLDVGNGSTKVAVGIQEVRIPSYVLPNPQVQEVPDTFYVEYLSGDRADLVGQSWLVGQEAYYASPLGALRVVDDSQGKPEFSLQLLTGALSSLPFQGEWSLNIAVSAHHTETLGDALREKLEGRHIVRFGPLEPEVKISIRVLKVLQEGAGVIASVPELSTDAVNVVFDLGNGTTVASQFGPQGRLISRQVQPIGVEALIDAISCDPELIKLLGKEADRQLVRRAIEDRSLRYGGRKVDITEFYSTHIRAWLTSAIRPVFRRSEQWLEAAQSIVAVGGGACLPGVAEALQSKGVTVAQAPLWANARGLAQIARLLGGE